MGIRHFVSKTSAVWKSPSPAVTGIGSRFLKAHQKLNHPVYARDSEQNHPFCNGDKRNSHAQGITGRALYPTEESPQGPFMSLFLRL